MKDGTRIIPSDNGLNPEKWVQAIICIPDNPEWIAIIKGLLWELTRGRTWQRDSRQSSIKEAQALGVEIYNTMAICDLNTTLERIAIAIENQKYLVNCCEPVTSPTNPPATYPLLPNPTDQQQQPPVWANEGQDYADVVCLLVNGIYAEVVTFARWVDRFDGWVLGVVAVVALLGLVFPEPITTAIGTVTLLAIATKLLAFQAVIDSYADLADTIIEYVQENENELSCLIKDADNLYNGVVSWVDYVTGAGIARLVEWGVPESVATTIFSAFRLTEYINTRISEWWESGNYPTLPADVTPLSCECGIEYQHVFNFTIPTDGTYYWTVYGRGANSDYSGEGEITMLPANALPCSAVLESSDFVNVTNGMLSTDDVIVHKVVIDIDVRQNFSPNQLVFDWYYRDYTGATVNINYVSGRQTIEIINPRQDAVIPDTGSRLACALSALWNGGGYNADLTDSVWFISSSVYYTVVA